MQLQLCVHCLPFHPLYPKAAPEYITSTCSTHGLIAYLTRRHLTWTVLCESLPFVIRSALAPSTTTKYERGWALWSDWASNKPEVRTCPSDPFHVAIYLNHLLQTNGTKGTLITAAYGMNWAHHVGGFAFPLEDPFVKLVLQG